MKATCKTHKDPFSHRCNSRMRVNRHMRTSTTFPNPPVSRRIRKELRDSQRQQHGALKHTYAYRFTTKPDNRVLVFGGDGHYSEGLVATAKDADILFIEAITRDRIKFAPWGGKTEVEKVKTIGAYHMFPSDMKRVQDESGVKNIVMVHVQNYSDPETFDRLGVLKEMQKEGVKNILQAQDGDLY